jgi:hypothetical protein
MNIQVLENTLQKLNENGGELKVPKNTRIQEKTKMTTMQNKSNTTTIQNKSTTTTIQNKSTSSKVTFASFTIIFIIYLLFFSIFISFYNMMLTRQIIASIPPNLREFLSDFQDITGYTSYEKISNQIILQYRVASFFIVSLFILCVNMIIYSYTSNNKQFYYAIRVIIECILITILPMYLLCQISFMNKVFENSIGYLIVKTMFYFDGVSFTQLINSFFIHTDYQSVDFTFLFTLFQLHNFGDVLHKFYENKSANFYINPDITEIDLQNLLQATICKNSIGHICWIFFTSIITTFLIYM